MRIEIHHHHHYPDEQAVDLCRLILERLETIIMPNIQDLQAAVASNTAADQSIITLLNGISQQLKDAQAANDPAAIQAVIDGINANTKALSDAVLANTTAAPVATAAPETPAT